MTIDIVACAEHTADDQILSLRTFAHRLLGDSRHPQTGHIEAPDWKASDWDAEEGRPSWGISALKWGVGVATVASWIQRHELDTWQVLSSDPSQIARDHGHVRLGSAEILCTGDRWSAGQYLFDSGRLPLDSEPSGLAPFATVAASGDENAVAGAFGTASVASGLAAAGIGRTLVFRDAGLSFPVSLPMRGSYGWRPSENAVW